MFLMSVISLRPLFFLLRFHTTFTYMKRLAFRSDFLSSYNYFWYGLKRSITHCLPNVLYTMLANVLLCLSVF